MSRGVHVRLAIILIISAFVGLGLTDIVLTRVAREEMVNIEAERLRVTAGRIHDALAASSPASSPAQWHDLVTRLAERHNIQITLLDTEHMAVADSTVGAADLRLLPSFATEPDVRTAQTRGIGTATLSSAEDGERHALTLALDPPVGRVAYLRITTGFENVVLAIQRLHRTVATLLLLATAGSIGIALIMARAWERRVQALQAVARSMVSGEATPPRTHLGEREFLGSLGQSLDEAAVAVQDQLATLREERDLLGVILESMGEGVMVLGPDGAIALINQAFAGMMGVDATVVGLTPIEALRVPEIAEICNEVQEDSVRATREVDWPADESRRWLVHASPLPDPGGAVCVLWDVTELRRLEAVRRDFVANVSHELRTPVTAIRGYAETLLQGPVLDADASRNFVETIHRHAERLSALISDLLDLSKIEAGAVTLSAEAVSVRETVERALHTVERAAAEKPIRLGVERLGADVHVRGDSRALEQVLANLLENAVRYTPAGGSVEVAAERENGEVCVIVADSGPGIPAPHRDRIFERFYRVDPGRSRDLGGTGLGLSIVRRLAEAMGGKVGVECPRGGGSRFWIRLPAA